MDKLGVGKIKDTKEVETTIVEEDEEYIKIITIIIKIITKIIIIVNIKTDGIKIILRLITRAKEVRSRMQAGTGTRIKIVISRLRLTLLI